MSTCPTCGHTSRPRATKIVTPLDTATMTDAQLFAHHKVTAPYFDLVFFLEFAEGLTGDETAAGIDLLRSGFASDHRLTMPRPMFYRRFYAMRDAIGQRKLVAHIAGRQAQIALDALAECAA